MPRFEPKPAIPGNQDVQVTVSGFRFSGNASYAEPVLQEIVKGYVGQQVDLVGLYKAANEVRQFYKNNGYFLAQTYIPAQQLPKGQPAVVEITVIEGRVGKATSSVKPESRFRESFIRGMVGAGIRPGQSITEEGLERPLLLLNDLAGASVQSTIKPGSEVGTADVDAEVGKGANIVTGSVDIDNHGNRLTGELRAGVTLSLNNPLGFGDSLTFRGQLTQDDDTNLFRLGYSIPVWYYGTRVGVNLVRLNYHVGKELSALDATGFAKIASVYGLHPVIRTRNLNVIVQGAVDFKELEDRTGQAGTKENRNILAAKFAATGDFRDGLLGGGLNAFNAALSYGYLDIKTPTPFNTDQTPGTGLQTHGNFTKLNVDFQRVQRVTGSLNVLLSIAMQEASKNLTSAEKMSLGGPNAIRAFPVGEATGDRGYVGTVEARYLLPFKFGPGDLNASVFYDFGRIQINANQPVGQTTPNDRTLSGYGLGLSYGKEGSFIARASLAFRGAGVPTSDTSSSSPRFWFQGQKWF